jgi:tetratricopeptide (TPR) repeat protein
MASEAALPSESGTDGQSEKFRLDTADIRQRSTAWIEVCRIFLESRDAVPYLDDIDELRAAYNPLVQEAEGGAIGALADEFERELATDPSDRLRRFAALSSFILGMTRKGLDHSQMALWRSGFRHLVSLCIVDKLTILSDLRFELHNSYLARNLRLAEDLLARIAILGLLSACELSLLRGHFWFLSVFGPRIRWELLQHHKFQYDFGWPWRLDDDLFFQQRRQRKLAFLRLRGVEIPDELVGDLTDEIMAVHLPDAEGGDIAGFCHPDLLQNDSVSEAVLSAWSLNPRSPRVWLPCSKPRPHPDDVYDFDSEEEDESPTFAPLTDDFFRQHAHYEYRDFEPVAPPELSEEQRQRLDRALHNLEEGFLHDQTLACPYAPILARSLFALSHFEKAAQIYSSSCRSLDRQWDVTFLTALCKRLSGKPEAATQVLLEFRERPSSPGEDPGLRARNQTGLLWWAAKWLAEEGKYDEAARHLKNEIESQWSPPESWQLSTILALGELEQERERAADAIRKNLAANPDVRRLLEGTVAELWPTFSLLQDDTRLAWLVAINLASLKCPVQGGEREYFRSAIQKYAWSVENELQIGVFTPFRAKVQGDPAAVEQARQLRDFDKPFSGYLLGKGELTFGQMITAIERSQRSIVLTDRAFANYAPKLSELILKQMTEVRDWRKVAVHGSGAFDSQLMRKTASHCRTILDAIHSRTMQKRTLGS